MNIQRAFNAINWRNVLVPFLIVALMLPFAAVTPVQVPTAARVQPVLLQMAAAQPDQVVGVIIQKTAQGTGVEELAARMGGAVTKDLSIINAFVAEMPAKDAVRLASTRGVRWVSLDAPVIPSGGPIDTATLRNVYVKAVGADRVWNEGPAYLQGQGVTVAVVDSGNCQSSNGRVKTCDDLLGPNNLTRVVATRSYDGGSKGSDDFGHGSLIEGVIGGTGIGSGGKYMGIAPNVNLVSVGIADSLGKALTSDVIAGLQWVLVNKAAYNIRVVNLSLNSSLPQSYHTSPLDAACEVLWFNGVVVVVAAGNNGAGTLYPPANDPYVITVGATDDKGTSSLDDDEWASFSAYGTDEAGAVKPDLVAPGKNLISIVPKNQSKIWKEHPRSYIGESASHEYYMRVSGTSFAAPVVSGAVALLLQDEPNLTPDQVKYRLKATANKGWAGYDAARAGAGYLDVYAAVHGTTTERANLGNVPQQRLAKMALIALWASYNGGRSIDWDLVNWDSVDAPPQRLAKMALIALWASNNGGSGIDWDSVNWDSVNWDSVNWDSVNWDSVNWDSVNWDSVNWDSVNWDSVNWDSVNWDSVNWDSVNWDSVNWDSVNWDSVNWDSVNWDSVNWDSVNWDSVNWDSVNWDSVNWDSVNWDSVNWDSVNWDSVSWAGDYWGD